MYCTSTGLKKASYSRNENVWTHCLFVINFIVSFLFLRSLVAVFVVESTIASLLLIARGSINRSGGKIRITIRKQTTDKSQSNWRIDNVRCITISLLLLLEYFSLKNTNVNLEIFFCRRATVRGKKNKIKKTDRLLLELINLNTCNKFSP